MPTTLQSAATPTPHRQAGALSQAASSPLFTEAVLRAINAANECPELDYVDLAIHCDAEARSFLFRLRDLNISNREESDALIVWRGAFWSRAARVRGLS